MAEIGPYHTVKFLCNLTKVAHMSIDMCHAFCKVVGSGWLLIDQCSHHHHHCWCCAGAIAAAAAVIMLLREWDLCKGFDESVVPNMLGLGLWALGLKHCNGSLTEDHNDFSRTLDDTAWVLQQMCSAIGKKQQQQDDDDASRKWFVLCSSYWTLYTLIEPVLIFQS